MSNNKFPEWDIVNNLTKILVFPEKTLHICTPIYRGVEQLVARWAHNPKVVSSSLAPATRKKTSRKACLFVFKTMNNRIIMFVTYVLYSATFNKIYVGFTSDLISRFHSHNSLAKSGYTIRYRPWKVIYVEFFDMKSDAMKREKELKSSRGRTFIKGLL